MACAGDITDQGFHKKKAKIEAKYCQKPAPASEMAQTLAKPSPYIQITI